MVGRRTKWLDGSLHLSLRLKRKKKGTHPPPAGGERLPPVETVRLHKDGSAIEVSISTSLVRDENGEVTSMISVSRDVTERNRIEERATFGEAQYCWPAGRRRCP